MNFKIKRQTAPSKYGNSYFKRGIKDGGNTIFKILYYDLETKRYKRGYDSSATYEFEKLHWEEYSEEEVESNIICGDWIPISKEEYERIAETVRE